MNDEMNYNCGLEEISTFISPQEFERFTEFLQSKIKNETLAEIPRDHSYPTGKLLVDVGLNAFKTRLCGD